LPSGFFFFFFFVYFIPREHLVKDNFLKFVCYAYDLAFN